MLKLKIAMNTDKICREGKYDLSSVLSTLDAVFLKKGLQKAGTGVYIGSGKQDDYAKFWSIIWSLAKKSWFMENVQEWLWYNSDDGADENDFAVEDIMAFCRANRIGIGA